MKIWINPQLLLHVEELTNNIKSKITCYSIYQTYSGRKVKTSKSTFKAGSYNTKGCKEELCSMERNNVKTIKLLRHLTYGAFIICWSVNFLTCFRIYPRIISHSFFISFLSEGKETSFSTSMVGCVVYKLYKTRFAAGWEQQHTLFRTNRRKNKNSWKLLSSGRARREFVCFVRVTLK